MSYSSSIHLDELSAFRENVAEDLQVLATLHDHEPNSELLNELRKLDFPIGMTLSMDSKSAMEASTMMRQGILSFCSGAEQITLDDLAADYTAIYLNHGYGVSPAESVWLDEYHLMCQESMFQVRTWYKDYGLEIPNWRIRPDDHLVYQLQFIACLLTYDNKPETLQKVATFMDEHLLRWLGKFASGVISRCDTLYFAGLATLTTTYCEELRDLLAIILQQSRPTEEEIEKRMQGNKAPLEEPLKYMPGVGPAV